MAPIRANPRLQVGSASWISEERSSALQIVESEAEEFTFSARNEVDWLNEHMAEIFSENQVNVAEIFKTPGKLRGKTPRTARKVNPLEVRAPLSEVFSATPRAGPSPFRQNHFEKPTPTFRVAEDGPGPSEPEPERTKLDIEDLFATKPPVNYLADSGYFGSQRNDATQDSREIQVPQSDALTDVHTSPKASSPKSGLTEPPVVEDATVQARDSGEGQTTEASFQSAKEEQTRNLAEDVAVVEESPKRSPEPKKTTSPIPESPVQDQTEELPSPQKQSPHKPEAVVKSPIKTAQPEEVAPVAEDEHIDDVQSQSDGSSPIRPIVRKSSLNFASLPAREPITTKKSIGNRLSRTGQLEQSRTSYYGRATGGKSLGSVRQENQRDLDHDEMDIEEPGQEDTDGESKMSRLHNKTSTQRLQDQISMLGKSQPNARPASKSIANSGAVPLQATQVNHASTVQEAPQHRSPQHKSPFIAPGAFPDDEEDSWIGPPTAAPAEHSTFSPRLQISKSHSTDVMEGIHGTGSIGDPQFSVPKRDDDRQRSPLREVAVPERTSPLGHMKSASTSVLRSPPKEVESSENQKSISVSNPNPSTGSADATTPPKSPSRIPRGSPLKAAKDKFSSILKTSRGLFASSAVVSAEAKTATMSPATSQIGMSSQPSFEEVLRNTQAYQMQNSPNKSQDSQPVPNSPGKPSTRRTRASTEREERRKEEEAIEAREAKEAKEAQKMADQLEKARQKVQEEARVYHLEQERVAVMQKEVIARKEQEKIAKASEVNVPKAAQGSPRKTKAQLEAEGIAAAAASTDELSNKDIEMPEVAAIPPPAPKARSQIGRPPAKRPLRPAKEPLTKAKPPTVIRVDTGSQRGHQYHPSNSTLAATLQESLGAPTAGSTQGLRSKVSTSSVQSKASNSSFRSAATKALEAAARKKEQDELAAQRKREAKQEVERQRAANKEEERRKEEQARRQEAERQRAVQREREHAVSLADAKKSASRQAMEKRKLEMEKAKQTGAPPPAIRPQPNGDLTLSMLQDKSLPHAPQQRNDMSHARLPRTNSTVHRPQDDPNRPVNSVLHNTAKVPPKRPLPQDAGDEHHSRPTTQRNPPSYHNDSHHSKRRKTSEDFEGDDDTTEPQPKMKAPPIRQSSSRQKDVPTKSIFSSGYANAPPPANLQRSTLIAQHNQSKPAHPMDMAQISKAPIPFATSSNQGNTQHKTPARPGQPPHGGKSTAKSAAKSSPRYQNGENIELPEINTDSEDEDSDAADEFVAMGWTNSPDLRKQLAKQETIDPTEIFGRPGPLNMEEVFSKSKDRWHKFRARTSSANWSGQDRLTEDEIRKDLEARERVRRQGGWTYDSMV